MGRLDRRTTCSTRGNRRGNDSKRFWALQDRALSVEHFEWTRSRHCALKEPRAVRREDLSRR